MGALVGQEWGVSRWAPWLDRRKTCPNLPYEPARRINTQSWKMGGIGNVHSP